MSTSSDAAAVTLIPFSFGLGAQLPATADGPAALHAYGLLEELCDDGIIAAWDRTPERVGPQNDTPGLGTKARRDLVLDAVTRHRDRVAEALRNGQYPVALGGDHAMATGTLSALANVKQVHGALGLLWIDAHLDAHTPETSPSSAIHGMPLAHLLGYGDEGFVGLAHNTPVIQPEHLIIIGAQSWEPEEYQFLQRLGVRIYFQQEIERRGIETVLAEACDIINNDTLATALSLDIDVLDPVEAAGFGSVQPGGLSVEGLYSALRWLAAYHDFDAIEMVEYNPERDDSDKNTAHIFEQSLKILLAGFGAAQAA